MAFCGQCGATISDDQKFCPECGAAIEVAAAPVQQQAPIQQAAPVQQQAPIQQAAPAGNGGQTQGANDFLGKLNNTPDSTASFDSKDIEANKIMALLAYLGFLFFIPLVAAPNSKFARFHANQGLLVFIGWIGIGVLNVLFTILKLIMIAITNANFIYTIFKILLNIVSWGAGIGVFVLAILGIMNALGGKAKELPFIGKFRIIK